tara:strand:- start:241 stop:579 length:339 start_codon:yes stop_codon:yes gene_type:complete
MAAQHLPQVSKADRSELIGRLCCNILSKITHRDEIDIFALIQITSVLTAKNAKTNHSGSDSIVHRNLSISPTVQQHSWNNVFRRILNGNCCAQIQLKPLLQHAGPNLAATPE